MAAIEDEVRSAILSYADMSWTLDEAYQSIMEEIAAALDGLPWLDEHGGGDDFAQGVAYGAAKMRTEARRALLGTEGSE